MPNSVDLLPLFNNNQSNQQIQIRWYTHSIMTQTPIILSHIIKVSSPANLLACLAYSLYFIRFTILYGGRTNRSICKKERRGWNRGQTALVFIVGTSFDKLEMESKELGHLFPHHLRQSYYRSFSTHDLPAQYFHLRHRILPLRMLFGHADQRNLHLLKKEGRGW